MLTVIEWLKANGWEEDGCTPVEIVRIPTVRSPVFGGCGGERAQFGGRKRFHKVGTDEYCTVGKRTTNFYNKKDGKPDQFEQVKTKDFIAVKTIADARGRNAPKNC